MIVGLERQEFGQAVGGDDVGEEGHVGGASTGAVPSGPSGGSSGWYQYASITSSGAIRKTADTNAVTRWVNWRVV